jgi:hypothetical protein
MLKILLAFSLLLQVSPLFAKPSEGDPPALSPQEILLATARAYARNYEFIWDTSLQFKTQKLFLAYQEVAEIGDETVDTESHVRFVTRGFAKALNDWALEVAAKTYGRQLRRYRDFDEYCTIILKLLTEVLPMKSEHVKGLFLADLSEESLFIEKGLQRQIDLKLQKEAEEKRGRSIQIKELLMSAGIGEAINYTLSGLHVGSQWSAVIGLTAFAVIYRYLTLDYGDSFDVTTLKMAMHLGTQVRCERMLSLSQD